MSHRTNILYFLIGAAVALGSACDPPEESDAQTAATSNASATNASTAGAVASTTPDSTPAPKTVEPEMYKMFVDRALMKLQRNITICTLPWKEEFPDRELKVVLVFELAPSGKVTRVEARVPAEATRIGRCIEQVVIRGRFSPGAPPEPFVKTMIFNPQDEQTKKLRVKDLPEKKADQ